MENMLPFKLHNILLSDGTETRPGHLLWRNTFECQRAVEILNSKYNHCDHKEISILDLGCGEGGYAIEFAREGYNVTAIDAREENIVRCRYAAVFTGTKLNILKGDVKDPDLYAVHYNVIFCSGLLYHIDQPVALIEQMSKSCDDMLIINTHFAREQDARYDVLPILNQTKKRLFKWLPFMNMHHFGLSTLVMNEGRYGRWYKEYSKNITNVEHKNWTAYSNHKSFWLTARSIKATLEAVGFLNVVMFDRLTHPNHDRKFFVGIKK